MYLLGISVDELYLRKYLLGISVDEIYLSTN